MAEEKSKALKPIDEVRSAIGSLSPQFKAALPPHVPVERFVRVLLTAVVQNKDLLNADRASLYGAAMKAAQAGLLPDSKEAALVQFGEKVTFMPMVAGLLKLVRNSGELSSITSQVVYSGDKFSYWVDTDGEHLKHEPNMLAGDRGSRIGVYSLAKTKDGGVYIEVLSVAQVEAIKKVSRTATKGPWSGPFEDEMWRKSAIRRLYKRLPSSTDLDMAVHADDEVFLPAEEPEAPAEPKVRSSRLSKIVKDAAPEQPAEQPPMPPAPEAHDTEVPI